MMMRQKSGARSQESGVGAKTFEGLLGKTFRHGGRGPEEYDCYGLCIEIYRRLGKHLPPVSTSYELEVNNMAMKVASDFFEQLAGPEPFCLVTFIGRPPYSTHVGVVLPDLYHFIHILEGTQVTIERLDGLLWKRKITGFFKPV